MTAYIVDSEGCGSPLTFDIVQFSEGKWCAMQVEDGKPVYGPMRADSKESAKRLADERAADVFRERIVLSYLRDGPQAGICPSAAERGLEKLRLRARALR